MTRSVLSWRSFIDTLAPRREGEWRFDARELAGSLGDLGTFLPLAVAMALVSGMDLGLIFIFAGLMNVLTGVWFRQPIPVQPMKAIAAVAIAEGLSAGEVASAGMIMGVAVFTLALVGGVDWIARVIPRPVVRGIQAGVGIKLAWKGLQWLGALPAIAWDGWVVAIIVGLVVVLTFGRRQPVLLYVFILGFGVLALAHPETYHSLNFSWPQFTVVWPAPDQWWIGLTKGAIPQLPLTMLNSVVAVCALSGDYFPGRGIEPRRMAASVGLMNLMCVPFGGMPMCHGAGGLAAQYQFGARTGGSVVMLGGLKVVAGLVIGASLLTALQSYPRSILAVMIIVAGFTLAKAAKDALRGRALVVLAPTVAGIVLVDTLHGFLIGCAVAAGVALWSRFFEKRSA